MNEYPRVRQWEASKVYRLIYIDATTALVADEGGEVKPLAPTSLQFLEPFPWDKPEIKITHGHQAFPEWGLVPLRNERTAQEDDK